jgi:hypothetical protein
VRLPGDGAWAFAWDTALSLLFFLRHSGMVRRGTRPGRAAFALHRARPLSLGPSPPLYRRHRAHLVRSPLERGRPAFLRAVDRVDRDGVGLAG